MFNKRLFVQFIHPGGEHQPDQGADKDWNKGPHKRKFLVAPGRYVSGEGTNEGSIVFWGEWEPQSRVVKRYANPVPDGPHFLYEPYYQILSSRTGLQNTDPFVFGEQFHFAICQQNTKIGPTQLRYLDRGSIILFGSCIDKQRFVIDTVFIVDSWIDYRADNLTAQILDSVSRTYLEVTLNTSCGGDDSKGQGRRLYFGATQQKPVDSMFSFFPCMPTERSPNGFIRPKIDMPNRITPHLTQGKKMTPIGGGAQALELWKDVKAQVERQGLEIGTFARLPEKRD